MGQISWGLQLHSFFYTIIIILIVFIISIIYLILKPYVQLLNDFLVLRELLQTLV